MKPAAQHSQGSIADQVVTVRFPIADFAQTSETSSLVKKCQWSRNLQHPLFAYFSLFSTVIWKSGMDMHACRPMHICMGSSILIVWDIKIPLIEFVIFSRCLALSAKQISQSISSGYFNCGESWKVKIVSSKYKSYSYHNHVINQVVHKSLKCNNNFDRNRQLDILFCVNCWMPWRPFLTSVTSKTLKTEADNNRIQHCYLQLCSLQLELTLAQTLWNLRKTKY